MAVQDTNDVVDEFLGDEPRAAEWRALRRSLGERLGSLRRARDTEAQTLATGSDKLKAVDTQIAALERQVAALKTEEVVAEFVENSLHVTLARSAADGEMDFEE